MTPRPTEERPRKRTPRGTCRNCGSDSWVSDWPLTSCLECGAPWRDYDVEERRSGKERRRNRRGLTDAEWKKRERRQAPREDRTLEWAMKVSRELWKSGTEAEELLRAKCRWEQKTRTAVILEWGDPREWKA